MNDPVTCRTDSGAGEMIVRPSLPTGELEMVEVINDITDIIIDTQSV